MRRFLYDTSIFVYALGREHPYKEPCREIVRKAAAGDLQGEASGELLQELLHQRERRTGNRLEAARAARSVAKLAWWHPVEPERRATGNRPLRGHAGHSARDAVFAALALNRDIDAILATDRSFDGIDGLERIDPADERAVATLIN